MCRDFRDSFAFRLEIAQKCLYAEGDSGKLLRLWNAIRIEGIASQTTISSSSIDFLKLNHYS
jgi:hypothetical protein